MSSKGNMFILNGRKIRRISIHIYLVCSLLLIVGCKKTVHLDPEVEKLGRATGPVERPSPAPEVLSASAKTHVGVVVETMDVSKYTYLRIKTATSEKTWAAIPKTGISVGQSVEVVESTVMKDFKSPTLNRTFSSIIFGVLKPKADRQDSGLSKEPKTPELPPGHPPINRKESKKK